MLKRAALIMALMILPVSAEAQSVTKLNETRIKEFYDGQAELFRLPYAEYLAGYDQRIHPELVFTNRTTLILPDQEPLQTDTVTLRKTDLIGNAQSAYDSAKDAKLSHDIKKITISKDGKSASVQNISSVKGINFPTSDGSPMKADALETCDDEVVLTENATVQIRKSTCSSVMTIIK